MGDLRDCKITWKAYIHKTDYGSAKPKSNVISKHGMVSVYNGTANHGSAQALIGIELHQACHEHKWFVLCLNVSFEE